MTDGVDLFARDLGVSRQRAMQLLRGLPETAARLDLLTATGDALREVATNEALVDLSEREIQHAAVGDDPESDLLAIVDAKAERKMRASIAAHESWARTDDPARRTAPARDAFIASFERKVDPDGRLPPEERRKRAEHLRKAHYKRMALKSAQVRRAKREAARGG